MMLTKIKIMMGKDLRILFYGIAFGKEMSQDGVGWLYYYICFFSLLSRCGTQVRLYPPIAFESIYVCMVTLWEERAARGEGERGLTESHQHGKRFAWSFITASYLI